MCVDIKYGSQHGISKKNQLSKMYHTCFSESLNNRAACFNDSRSRVPPVFFNKSSSSCTCQNSKSSTTCFLPSTCELSVSVRAIYIPRKEYKLIQVWRHRVGTKFISSCIDVTYFSFSSLGFYWKIKASVASPCLPKFLSLQARELFHALPACLLG